MACLLAYILIFSLIFAPCLASELKREHCHKECQEVLNKHERNHCERMCLEKEGEEEEEKQEEKSPFLFDEQSFKHWARSEQGYFKVLERFSKKSPWLIGIENYRVGVIEAGPRTFIMPNHWDAAEVFFVINGKGVISILMGENRESYDINEGDVMRVPTGAQVYLINKDDEEKLKIASLIIPISTPGRFKEFYAVGGKDKGSFLGSFSKGVIETSFNVDSEEVLRLFEQENRESMVKATEEQISAISKHSEGGGTPWPFAQSRKPFNLLKRRPACSNKHGELHEVNANDYQQLRDLNIDVSVANITKGSMMMLHYNTEGTKIAYVMRGRGYFEMACPHISSQKHQREREQYQSVRSELSPGKVIVIPAGHPIASIASRDEGLQILCFGIRAENNQKIFLSGKNNVWRKMEKEAKELAFRRSEREVDKILNAQSEQVFGPGPEKSRKEENNGQGFAEF
ncbi:hypothetical protein J5N97_027535 [Dioscorea zingiberensis]|uniref:Cupin type-1 domain-containing protein n=1 Tax=Dioscorea zingiberensis TaxID=325984 RepID=A0A9D5C4H9_9LILI|nr:hypothetical protein J5N97_027535 [Dioscorea zingiberensis]